MFKQECQLRDTLVNVVILFYHSNNCPVACLWGLHSLSNFPCLPLSFFDPIELPAESPWASDGHRHIPEQPEYRQPHHGGYGLRYWVYSSTHTHHGSSSTHLNMSRIHQWIKNCQNKIARYFKIKAETSVRYNSPLPRTVVSWLLKRQCSLSSDSE